MAADALVQTRIDRNVKDNAASVLADMGLTLSDAVRIMLTRTARDGAFPLDLLSPNAETSAAMEEARQGGLASFDSVEALMRHLNEAS